MWEACLCAVSAYGYACRAIGVANTPFCAQLCARPQAACAHTPRDRPLNHAFDDFPVANLNRMHTGLFIFVKTKTHEIAFVQMVIVEILQ